MAESFLYERASRPASDRPDQRERLVREGASSLSDAELIAVLIGTGTRGRGVMELAHDVLKAIDAAGGSASPQGLSSLFGIGEAKAAILGAAMELGRRHFGYGEKRITRPQDLWPFLAHYADRKQERFLCTSLNGAHEVLAIRVVSVGLVNRTVVHPREVFAEPIVDRACAVIVAHNHPSGRLEPSPEDLDITHRLRSAGRTLGIELLDHLVFSSEAYFSFVERGLLAAANPD